MSRLQRFYLKEVLILFISLMLSLSVLFSVLSIIEQLDELQKNSISGLSFVFYGLLRIPEFMKYLIPMALLLSVIFVFGLASRRNEFVAIKASGGNLRKFFIPFIILSFVVALLNLVVAELITPYTQEILMREFEGNKNRKVFKTGKNGIWMKGADGSLFHAGLFLPEEGYLQKVSIFYLKDGLLQKRIEAKRGKWIEDSIVLKSVKIYDIKNERVQYADKITLNGVFSMKAISSQAKRLSNMGVQELMKYRDLLNRAGYKSVKIDVDINSRLAYPLTNIFMMLVGIFISLKSRKGKGIVNAGLGILISVAYWFSFTFTLSLGYASVVSPVIAGWFVPFMALVLGAFMFREIPV